MKYKGYYISNLLGQYIVKEISRNDVYRPMVFKTKEAAKLFVDSAIRALKMKKEKINYSIKIGDRESTTEELHEEIRKNSDIANKTVRSREKERRERVDLCEDGVCSL